jgi:hypothetical protein
MCALQREREQSQARRRVRRLAVWAARTLAGPVTSALSDWMKRAIDDRTAADAHVVMSGPGELRVALV